MPQVRSFETAGAWRAALLLAIICGLTFVAGLGRAAISDSDEAFYAEAGREMVETGDWLTPHYNYEHRFEKPVLYYWLVAATFVVGGVGEAGARLWSALAGFGLALVAYGCGRWLYDRATGLLAGAIVGTSLGYFLIARLALPDLPLAFFITASIAAGLVALDHSPENGDRRQSRRWWLIAAVLAALGFLTKGPLGLLLPGLILGAIALVERRLFTLRIGDLALAALAFLAVALPWYVAMTSVHGTAYLYGFFMVDNVERFATTTFNDPKPWWYYVPIVMGGMLPWSPLALLWARPAIDVLRRRRALRTVEIRLLLWAALPFLLFTASIGKQPRYVLPILPPLAMLLARTIHMRIAERSARDGRERSAPRDGTFALCSMIAGLLIVLLGALVFRLQPLLLEQSRTVVAVASVAIVLAGAAVIGVAWSRAWRQVPATLVAASIVTVMGLQYGVLASPRDAAVQRMADLLAQHRRAGEPWTTHDVFVRNLTFYARSKQTRPVNEQALIELLQSPQRVLCVMRRDEVARFETAAGVRLTRLADVPYFDPALLKLRSVLWPDVQRDVQSVVLVSNHD